MHFWRLQEGQSRVSGDTLSMEHEIVVLSASSGRCVRQSSMKREAIVGGHHMVINVVQVPGI